MRSLWPTPGPVDDVLEWYPLTPGAGRPFVRVNMIASLDGAVAFAGRSGQLGGPADQRLFFALRSQADLVLVGATTAREEHYGQARLSDEVQQARARRGQVPVPPVAVVTRSGHLEGADRLFREEGPTPVIITSADGTSGALGELAAKADVIVAGPPGGPVDLTSALATLRARGVRHVVCEGGPGLNTSLAAAGAVDELCLTLSPKMAGCVGGQLVGGWLGSGSQWLAQAPPGLDTGPADRPPLNRLVEMQLTHVLEEDGFLFLRHLVRLPSS